MVISLLGIFSLLLLFIYDISTIKKLRFRSLFAFLGYLLHLLAIVAAAMQGGRFLPPPWTVWPAWILTVGGAVWLCYCLFLFPALSRTYVTENPVLTTDGPYALTRHPGILGYIAFLTGLIVLSRSGVLLQNSILWLICNLLYVIVQDKWVFSELFPDYQVYRETTPMLFPNLKSISKFINTI